jgi:hypothetical protein
MIIEELLDIANVFAGTNGTVKGKLYLTVTVTMFPGLLQIGGQGDPPV